MATSAVDQTLNLEFLIAQAHEARADYVDAAQDYRILLRREMELEDSRHVQKLAACLRMREQTSPLTEKPFSGSSAESYAEVDPAYSQHLSTLRDVVFEKNAARTRMESAKLRCDLAIAAVRANLPGVV